MAPVYLDHNATTPLAPEVVDAITASLGLWANPSSSYPAGRAAAAAVAGARRQVAAMLGAAEEEVTFTSGGTESNHLAIMAGLAAYRGRGGGGGDACPGGGPPCPCPASTDRVWRKTLGPAAVFHQGV